ncbi:MAG: CBS domain-containing protein [Saprospiraceae bacterium]|nr:CBS domain-containing protein [Saprospiraceae bacterium]
MGEQKVSIMQGGTAMQRFVRNLLRDVQALEYMLENEMFETSPMRIGAEQEMVIVDSRTFKPACINMALLNKMKQYDWVGTELAQFNLETNLSPRVFTGTCLSDMDKENRMYLDMIRAKLKPMRADICLTGILPTLRKGDLDMRNLTPNQRYRALMQAIDSQSSNSTYELNLSGIDELSVKHDSPLLEACNTSFQVHLQVTPDTFVPMYNMAQALAAPIMAIAANSPIVFGKRLWHESRIALFQQALDIRSTHDHMRERSPRVSFGTGWLDKSLVEIYKEDISRFRVLLAGDTEEDSIAVLQEGGIPRLRALQVHNSTVYRWNRPCYGISENGMPHLRIENRVLPAGPTTTDAIANAAFWLGAMIGMGHTYKDIRTRVSWEDVRDNFAKAAQFGIDSAFNWFDDKKISACDLVLHELLPMAKQGLELRGVAAADIDKYLGTIEQRARDHMNGARWQLRTFTKLIKECTRDEALTVMTAAIVKNQWKDIPIHKWTMPELADLDDYRPSKLRVEEFMETDLFTVQQDDIIELVAEMMDWRKIRYMPVEDAQGNLCGLITSRLLLRYFSRKNRFNGKEATTVKDIMIATPTTVGPDMTIIEAMRTMRQNRIGCLPVVKGEELIGIITEMDFLRISARLIERLEK